MRKEELPPTIMREGGDQESGDLGPSKYGCNILQKINVFFKLKRDNISNIPPAEK